VKDQHRPVVFNGFSHHPEAVSDRLELAALPSAVSLTRRLVEAHLRKWHLEEMTDTAALVASELVTNAISAWRDSGITTPLFRKTSCGVSAAHQVADYNGHWGVRELCDICPASQARRCCAAHAQPTGQQFEAVLANLC
jgi:hypothetical protein